MVAVKLPRQLFAAFRGQRVVRRAAIFHRSAPLAANPALEQQALERRIKRTLLDIQYAGRGRQNELSDFEAMQRSAAGNALHRSSMLD
jgi:hypothetical protein